MATLAKPQEYSAWPLNRNKAFSDIKIVCGDTSFDAHKFIICDRSSVLAAALQGEFKEAKDNIYTITQFEPEIVDRMLDFMYTADYSYETKELRPIVLGEFAETTAINETTQELFLHLRMNCIAEYYNVQQLREEANMAINMILEDRWDDVHFWYPAFVEQAHANGADRDLQSIIMTVTVRNMFFLVNNFDGFAHLDIPTSFFTTLIRNFVISLNDKTEKHRDACQIDE